MEQKKEKENSSEYFLPKTFPFSPQKTTLFLMPNAQAKSHH